MNSKQAFYTTFHILDKLYDKTKEPALAQFLGDMNPFLFENAISADPAVYEDFCKIWDGVQEHRSEQIERKIAIEFLLSYQEMYNYDIETVLKCFDDLTWSKISKMVIKKFSL